MKKLKPASRYRLNAALRKGGFTLKTSERTIWLPVNFNLRDLNKVNKNRINRAKKIWL